MDSPSVSCRPMVDSRTARNISLQALGTGFNAAVGFLLLAALARWLGAAAFTEYATALSGAILGLILIEAAWPTLIARTVAGEPRDHALHSGLLFAATSHAVFVGGTLSLLASAFGQTTLASALACMIAVGLCNLVSARLRGEGRFATDSAWQATARVLSATAIAAAALFRPADPALLFLAWTGSLALLLLTAVRRPRARLRFQSMSTWTPLFPILVLEATVTLLIKGDLALVSWAGVRGSDLQSYAVSTRLIEAALLIFAPVGNVLLPTLRRQRDEALQYRRTVRSALLLAVATGLLGAGAACYAGAEVMRFAFGTGYSGAASALRYAAWALPFACVNVVLVSIVLARNVERLMTPGLAVCATLYAVLVVGGASVGGATGAICGSIAGHANLSVWLLMAVRRVPE